MAVRQQLQALRNHPNLQRLLIADARPTGRQLGAGSYGSVEELEVSGVVCAGKKIHETLIEQGNVGAENIASRYVEECQLMSDLRHPHLVQFLGVCFLPNSTLPVLVMECLVTNLDDLLEHNPDIPLSLKQSILVDVARGLVYLHSRNPPVIHRDLSARNVLLNSAMVAKIADLGNARIVNFQPGQLARTLSRIPGTMVYMPPEAFEDTSKYGPSLDIFSFGHLSLFTITQVFPGKLLQYTYRDPENPRSRLARTEVQRRNEYIKLLHQRQGEQHPLVLLVKQCLDDEPSERPSAQELFQQLEGMRIQIEDPYQPLTKLEAIRMLREKDQDLHTQVEASRIIRQELEALQTRMEELQLETSSQLSIKDAEVSRLGEEMRSLQQEHSSKLTTKDAQLTAKDAENSRLSEDLKSLQADLEAKDSCIREMGAATEKREAELGDLQSQLGKALQEHSSQLAAMDFQLTEKDLQLVLNDGEISKLGEDLRSVQASLETREACIQEMRAESEKREAEMERLTTELRDFKTQLQKAQDDLDARDSCIREMKSETEKKECEIDRLTTELRDSQTQLQKAEADLVARDSHIREMGSETEKKEAEMLRQTGELRSLKRKQRAPEYQNLLFKHERENKKSAVDDSSTVTASASSALYTVKPAAVEKDTSAMVQPKPAEQLHTMTSGSSKKKPADSEGGVKASGEGEGKGKGKGTMREMNKPPDQPESTIVRVAGAKKQENRAEDQQKEAEIHRQLTKIPSTPHKNPVLPGDLDARDCIREMGSETEKKECEIDRLTTELRDSQTQLQKAEADLVARDSHIRAMGSETEKKEAEMLRQTGELRSLKRKQKAPEYQNLLFKHERVNKKSTVDDSSTVTASASSALYTGKPAAVEKDTSAMVQPKPAEQLHTMTSGSSKKKPADSKGGAKASGEGEGKGKGKGTMREMNKPPDQPESTIERDAGAKKQENRAEDQQKEAEIHRQLTKIPSTPQKNPVLPKKEVPKKKASLREDSVPGGDSGGGAGLKRTVSAGSAVKGKRTSIVPIWAPGTEVIGLYNFPGTDDQDLPFNSGESLTIISQSKYPNWYKAKRCDDKEGMIPHNLVQEKSTEDASLATPSSVAKTSSIEKGHKADKGQKKEEPKKKAAVPEHSSSGGDSANKIELSFQHGEMKEKHSEDTSSPIASAAALNSSTPHTKPQADENYATAEIRPRKASTEGLQEDWVPGTEVVGKYDFPVSAAHLPKDLPFKRGDSLTIISKSMDPNWYKAKRDDGREGMIPRDLVQKKTAGNASSSATSATVSRAKPTGPRQAVKLQGMPWFHSVISRESAEELLRPYKNGTYLVRQSQEGDCTLCVSYGSKVEHYRIRRNDNNWVTADDEEYFENLVKLVERCQRDADWLCCRLRHPVIKKSGSIQYTVSLQDFEEGGWAIPSDSLQKESLIVKGEFKDVWLGEYKGSKVAMVMTKDLIYRDPMDRKPLLAEAAIMTALQHPNLVCLIGVTLDKPPVYLITEYMAKGSLLDYLRSRGRAEISKQNQLDFARDVCKGMVYLESQNLVHRYLAARNVLLGDDNAAKVSDFRLTREQLFKTERREKLLVKWTAAEALREMKFTNKSDVWSFGVLLWEIYSYGRVPYPHLSVNDVLSHIEQGGRMDAPGDCPDGICQIMRACWDKDPSKRPNFARIESLLDSISV